MRDYGKVYSTFWASMSASCMSDDGKLLALYLMTCSHSTIAGVFRLPDAYAAEDLGWVVERVQQGFAELLSKGFANRCETTKWVWVVKHLEWNPPENPNQRKSAVKIAKSVPTRTSWLPEFMRVCGVALALNPAIEPNPSETVSKGSANQEQEQKQDQEIKTATSIEVARARRGDEPQLTLVDGGQDKPWTPPACPHLEVLALWAEVLPALPQHEPAQWKGSRADHLRARWRETAEDKRWPDQAAGLAYFRKLFVYVGKSQFLTGRAPTREGKRPFFVELEWLVKPMSWAKLIEGKYHSEAA